MHNQPVGSSTEINVGSGVDKCSRVNARPLSSSSQSDAGLHK